MVGSQVQDRHCGECWLVNTNQLIDKFVGKPFVEGEFDCYKLVISWFGELGYIVPDYSYQRFWYREGKNYFIEEYYKLWRKLASEEPVRANDVALFKVLALVPNHVGICLGDGRFIHCAEGTGTVVSRLDKYKNLFYGIFRLKELENCQ